MEETTGLVLGGGGARGLAHLGAIDVLAQKGINPKMVVGCSIGALIGALYATTGSCEAAKKRIEDYFTCDCYTKIEFGFIQKTEDEDENDGLLDGLSRYFRKKFLYNVILPNRKSLVSHETYMENINFLIDDIDIRDTKIPFYAVCTDLNTGTEIVLSKGSLRKAVAASSAIPGIFQPIELNGHLLVDGGWVNQLPVDTCRSLGADYVIAVNVARELEQDFSSDTALDIIRRSNAITRTVLNQIQSENADATIDPEVGDISWTEFSCVEKCMEMGRIAAEEFVEIYSKSKAEEKSSLFEKFFG